MALLAKVNLGATIQKHNLIEVISDEEINLAMQRFALARGEGIIITGEFSDESWYMSNEADEVKINFNFDEIAICKQKNTSIDHFVLAVKSYISLCIGKYTLLVFPRMVNAIRNAVTDTDCFTKMPDDIKSLQQPGVNDFLSLLPWVDECYLLPPLENPYELQRQRSLAEYMSYFIFNELMINFWSIASNEEKDFYYPLYLFWNVSMIIPNRVTEFSVTPKQRLEPKNGHPILMIRRTCIKGGNDIEKRYKLDTDYKIYPYEITDKIASEIMDYQQRVEKVGEAEIDSIFSDKLFMESKLKVIPRSHRGTIFPHMRSEHFDYVLDCFYIHVVEGIYNYSVYEKETFEKADKNGQKRVMMPGEIVKMNLGDTRHIALQNLLLNGCNLLMAREISGHDTVDMIFHYSGNLKNLIKCKAYNLYELSKQKGYKPAMVTPSLAELILKEKNNGPFINVDSGRCYSQKFINSHDACDCFAVEGNCSLCIFHEGNENLADVSAEQEKIFCEKVARVKIWMNSSKKLKDKEQMVIAGEEMTTAAKNLEIFYFKMLRLGGEL